MMEKKIKILVCCHKQGEWLNDNIYMPIQCGKAIANFDLGIQGDDIGDNISVKNPYYCELTAMYWAWKNLQKIDYIGLCHYRRYFNFKSKSPIRRESQNFTWKNFKNTTIYEFDYNLLEKYDVILATPYLIWEPKAGAFAKSIGIIDYCIMEKVLLKLYPEYRKSLVDVFYLRPNIPMRCMFVMKWENFDKYCQWLFPILHETEKYVKLSPYSVWQRIFSYYGENLLFLWCYHNKLRVKERDLAFITNTNLNSSILLKSIRNIICKLGFKINLIPYYYPLNKIRLISEKEKKLMKTQVPNLFDD